MKQAPPAFNVPLEFAKADHGVSKTMQKALEDVLVRFRPVADAARANDVGTAELLAHARRIERDFLIDFTQAAQMSVTLPAMNMEQFETIAKLIRSKEPARTAAMMVLVLGWSSQSVVKTIGLQTQSVWNTVHRFRTAHARLTKVFFRPQLPVEDSKTPSLTPEQFDAIAFLIRSRKPASSAAELVLVYNQGNAHAAREVGIKPQSCWNTIDRFKAALKLIQPNFPGLP